MTDKIIQHCIGFDWDESNTHKNWNKHQVSYLECEQVFFNSPLLAYNDTTHSNLEKRMYVLGQTNMARSLFIVFAIRNNLIRVISARDMSKKERRIYETNTTF